VQQQFIILINVIIWPLIITHSFNFLKLLIMTKSSMQKYSILGLVLLAASAVTAAIVPSKAKEDRMGKVLASTGGFGNQVTCVDTVHPQVCNVTADTVSTGGVGTSANRFSSTGKHSSQSPE
jgi:hypothetical protein